MIDYKTIGERIKAIRQRRGFTQAYLAELSGIEPSNISHIERAATKLSLPTLVSIANALGSTLDEIVYDNLDRSAHISQKEINSLLVDCNDSELRALAEIIKTTKSILRRR